MKSNKISDYPLDYLYIFVASFKEEIVENIHMKHVYLEFLLNSKKLNKTV